MNPNTTEKAFCFKKKDMIKIEPKLEAFLKEEGALEDFKDEIFADKDMPRHQQILRGVHEVCSLSAYFSWRLTKQGFEYWKRLSDNYDNI